MFSFLLTEAAFFPCCVSLREITRKTEIAQHWSHSQALASCHADNTEALALHNNRQLNLTDPNTKKNIFCCCVFSNTVYTELPETVKHLLLNSHSIKASFYLFPPSPIYNATAVNNSTFSFFLLDFFFLIDWSSLRISVIALISNTKSVHAIFVILSSCCCFCDAPVRGCQGLPKYFKRFSGSITLLFWKTICLTLKFWNSVYLWKNRLFGLSSICE